MINKLLFFIKLIFIQGISKLKVLYLQIVYHGVSLPSGIIIPRGVVIATSGGGTISIGRNVTLCRDAQLISQGGQIRLDDNVHIGVVVIIVSLACIQIGKDTLISEYVIIRDHDHNFDSRAIRNAGFKTSPISIGVDFWLGCKSTVLRDSTLVTV